MRTVPLKICGEELALPVSFDAGTKLEAAGYDPLRTAFKLRRGDFVWSSVGVVTVLYIGAKEAGSKLDRKTIGQAVYDAGTRAYLPVVDDYLTAFVEAEPEHPVPGSGDDSGNEAPQ